MSGFILWKAPAFRVVAVSSARQNNKSTEHPYRADIGDGAGGVAGF